MSGPQAKPDGYYCGTLTGYRYGCRCDRCREANTITRKLQRASGGKGICGRCQTKLPEGKRGPRICSECAGAGASAWSAFTSTCWCEEECVEVTPRDVLNGITHSCGREGCKPTEAK
jgi:hypothetical protein